MGRITSQLIQVKHRIELAEETYQRGPESVALIAVSKTFPAHAIEEAMHAGQTAFGENYVQEAIQKIQVLEKLRPWLEWHFIGPIQSNKTSEIAEHFDWVQSVDRLKVAQRLSLQRAGNGRLGPLQVLVQVNISGEASKGGVVPDEALALCDAIAPLPNLTLRGLMAIPEPVSPFELQRSACASLRTCYEAILKVRSNHPGYYSFDTLSIGMSDDLEAAIAEGSTMVRVGTAIFGGR